jgi:O-antigen/teichoic acid export membrane protein
MSAEASTRAGAAGPGRSLSSVFQRLKSRGVSRLSWGVADQAVSSVTNFAMSIYIARTLGAVQFGAFSLAYVTYSFALNASRGLATDPLMVRYSGANIWAWRRAVADCTGTASLVGLAGGAVVLAVSLMLSGTARAGFLALGLTLPVLLLQDSWRYAFFALGRGVQAFINDMVWAGTLIPALLFLRLSGHGDVFWCVLVWGATAAVAAAVGPLQAKVLPRPAATFGWISKHRDLGPRYLVENTANSSAAQLRTYSVGIVAGLAAVGYLQAANTLMGPFLVIFMGISLVTVPEAARVLREKPAKLRQFCLIVGSALAVMAMLWGFALLIMLPRGLGNWLLGPIWRPTYGLVLPFAISFAGACFSVGAMAGLHALGNAKRSVRAMVITSAVYVACSLGGAYLDGARGAAWAGAVATPIGAILWWLQLSAATRHLHDQASGRGERWLRRRRARHRKPNRILSRRRTAFHSAEAGGHVGS